MRDAKCLQCFYASYNMASSRIQLPILSTANDQWHIQKFLQTRTLIVGPRAHHFQGTHWVAMFQKNLNFKGCFLVRFEAGRIQLFILILTQLHLYKHCSDNIDIVQSSCSLNCMFALSLSEQNSNLKISWFAVTRENQQSYICLICLKLHLCTFSEVLNIFIYHCLKWLLHAYWLLILEIVFNFNIICSYTYLAIYTKQLYIASYEIINIAQTVASSLVTFNQNTLTDCYRDCNSLCMQLQ